MNVVFEEQAPIVHLTRVPSRGIIGWMLRHNMAHSASHAQTTLLIVAILFFALSGFMIRSVVETDTIDTTKNLVPAMTR